MRTRVKVLILAVLIAVPAMMLGPVIQPNPEGGAAPAAGQMPYFIFLALWDGVLLGLGTSFLLFGQPVIRDVSPDSRVRAYAMYLSVGQLMVSQWPHLNLHRHDEADNLQGLLYIDNGFHVPLMIAALILAYSFIPIARSRMREGPPTVKGAAGAPDSVPAGQAQQTDRRGSSSPGPHGIRFPQSLHYARPVADRANLQTGRVLLVIGPFDTGGSMQEISWADFEKVDVRLGRVVEAEPFPEARKPSVKLAIDFGSKVGVKRSSAQITAHYAPETLLGKQLVAVVNFPAKRIAGFESEVLVLGVPDEEGAVVLLAPDREVPPGARMF